MAGEPSNRGIAAALGAAVLFGASPPLAKLLVPDTGPLMLAALLYLGAGIALAAASALPAHRKSPESRLRAGDLPLLGVIVCFGGIIAPLLMLWGLERISAVLASLLLNLEAPFTVLLAVAFFGDSLGSRAAAASLLVVAGAAWIGGVPGSLDADAVGMLAVVAACASWGLDNNLTQRLSLRDPAAVARAKALGAGVCMLTVALTSGSALPPLASLGAALVLGFVSYGASLVLAVRAMRELGAARQAVYFAAAPFVGAVLAVGLLGERPGLGVAVGGALIVGGLALLLGERHAHWHVHQEMEHDHLHVHDDHHRHDHGSDATVEPHSHVHRHEPFAHAHGHMPDVHHRHQH